MELKTRRLTLRPQRAADAPALFAILNDADAMRFWNRPPVIRLAVVEEMLAEQDTAMVQGLCCYWTVLEGAEAIGSMDLSLIREGSAELGFLFRRDRWGMGLASEAAAAVTAHAMGPLGLKRLAAAIQTENKAAARVLEKTGFVLVERRSATIASGQTKDCAFYVLDRLRAQAGAENSL